MKIKHVENGIYEKRNWCKTHDKDEHNANDRIENTHETAEHAENNDEDGIYKHSEKYWQWQKMMRMLRMMKMMKTSK